MKTTYLTIVELPGFTKDVIGIFTEEEVAQLFGYLAITPEAGDVIPDTGSIRKLRWGARGKGKRGGARVIYYTEDYPLFAMAAYAKNEKIDLSTQDKKELRNLIDVLIGEFARNVS